MLALENETAAVTTPDVDLMVQCQNALEETCEVISKLHGSNRR
jgi:hypothetical protein